MHTPVKLFVVVEVTPTDENPHPMEALKNVFEYGAEHYGLTDWKGVVDMQPAHKDDDA